jgi:hypothetical protein
MKKRFVLDPLHGVGPIRLGASRDAVLAAFGTPAQSFYKVPTSRYPTDAWFENGFQVFYGGDQPAVEYIELSHGSGFEAVVFGIPVFATTVPVLVGDIGRRAKLDDTDPELGYSYIFPSLELAFWRPDDDDEETPCFYTVGIGVPGYFSI